MTKLEACKHLDQAMGLEGIDEKTWDTIFGIKSRLCFCNGEDEEDAKSLETVWYSIRDCLKGSILECNLLNVVRAIRSNCWEFCRGAEWHCECRNCPWDGNRPGYEEDELDCEVMRESKKETTAKIMNPGETVEMHLKDLFTAEWEPRRPMDGAVSENCSGGEEQEDSADSYMEAEEESYTEPDDQYVGEMQEDDGFGLQFLDSDEDNGDSLFGTPDFI